MAAFRAFRLPIWISLLALPFAGCIGASSARAAELGNQLDTMAYGGPSEPAKPQAKSNRKSSAPTAAVAPAIDAPPPFEENSPGLLAVLGFDNRNFATVPTRAAPPALEARASIAVPPPPPPPMPAFEENAPGLLAALGLDKRELAPPPVRPAPAMMETVARVAPLPVIVGAPIPVPVAMPVSHGHEYRLGAGDKLRVVVFGQEGLTNTYSIDAGGAITMPLIGRVSARGQTPGGLAEDITARLRKGFIRDPSVAVEIESYRPFFILGEVAAPGQYPYVPNMSVEAAVAIAGGFSPRARRDIVTVTHPAEGGLLRAVVPLGTPLSPGDTVLVGERWF